MDPGTALGVASLAYDAVKDLYEYYRTWKDCDKDVAELRARLLWLESAFKAAKRLLSRPGDSGHDHSLVESALVGCSQATEDLNEILEKISLRTGQPVTALQKLQQQGRRAIYPFRKSTIQALTENVDTCQASLQFAVHLLGLDTEASTLEKLRLLDARLTSGLDDLESELKQLQISQHSNAADIRNEIKVSASSLENVLKSKEDKEKAQIIVNSLGTGELRRRRQDVRDNYPGTFDWILDGTVSSFAEWMRSRDGLFWIRGKAGSGKSTLMKFLVEDERTDDLLRMWASNVEVSIVQHFFWISGTPLQKSHQGMLQDLLYQILNSDHGLIPLVCHKRWKSPNPVGQDWTTRELSTTLEAAVAKSQRYFCLFIDGLDEYAPDVEHRVLISFLRRLAGRKNVKMVVSSRPWQIFESAFGNSDTLLYLEDLTYNDILTSTWFRLIPEWDATTEMHLSISRGEVLSIVNVCTKNDQAMADLVRSVIEKSMGVFLWVSLVVDALCERLRARQTVAELQRHVDSVPADLYDYFRDKVLKRIAKTWRKETAFVLKFQVVAVESGYLLNPGLRELTKYGTEFFDDPDWFAKVEFSTRDGDEFEMFRKVRQLVHECCRDLIIVEKVDGPRLLSVRYSHRSVHDFLMQDEIQRSISMDLPHHFADDFLFSKLMLLETGRPRRNQDHFNEIIADLLLSLTLGWIEGGRQLEGYFDLMPTEMVKRHSDTLVKHLDCSSASISEKYDLRIVHTWGMAILALLRRRGLELLAQQILETALSKWPSVVCDPVWWVTSSPQGLDSVEIGSINFDKGDAYLQTYLDYDSP